MLVDPDIAVINLAEGQYGVFTRRQAIARGHSSRMINYRIETGRWGVLHPETYVVAGTPQSWHRDQIAATYWAQGLAGGRAAGKLHGLPGCDDAPIEVLTTLRHKVMPRCGIVVHLTKRLPPEQVVTLEGIPATSVERTLLDLCGQMPRRRAAIALDNALFRGLTTIGDLDFCLFRTARQGRNGCAVLRDLVKERLDLTAVPNSALETVMFEELFAPGFVPMPELQYEIFDASGGFVARPDFVYPDEKIVIEGHSSLWHGGKEARTHDLERHDDLVANDYRVLYVTWPDVTQYLQQTVARIRQLRAERTVSRVPGRAHV